MFHIYKTWKEHVRFNILFGISRKRPISHKILKRTSTQAFDEIYDLNEEELRRNVIIWMMW